MDYGFYLTSVGRVTTAEKLDGGEAVSCLLSDNTGASNLCCTPLHTLRMSL